MKRAVLLAAVAGGTELAWMVYNFVVGLIVLRGHHAWDTPGELFGVQLSGPLMYAIGVFVVFSTAVSMLVFLVILHTALPSEPFESRPSEALGTAALLAAAAGALSAVTSGYRMLQDLIIEIKYYNYVRVAAFSMVFPRHLLFVASTDLLVLFSAAVTILYLCWLSEKGLPHGDLGRLKRAALAAAVGVALGVVFQVNSRIIIVNLNRSRYTDLWRTHPFSWIWQIGISPGISLMATLTMLYFLIVVWRSRRCLFPKPLSDLPIRLCYIARKGGG